MTGAKLFKCDPRLTNAGGGNWFDQRTKCVAETVLVFERLRAKWKRGVKIRTEGRQLMRPNPYWFAITRE
jgi:hypothetical protein